MKNILIFTFILFSFHLNAQDAWSTLKTGAGGWITGMDINPDGTKFIRSDVGGAYRLDVNADTWQQIVTSESMPENDIHWSKYSGVLSIASAPSDVNRTYMAYYNTIYISNNKGEDWNRTNFIEMEMRANDDDSKLFGERLEVDPNNKDVVFFGSINNGMFKTEDGMNWTSITDIPNGALDRGVRSIVFDKNSTIIDGKTQVIYVAVDGEGIYKTSNGGSTFNLITDGLFPNSEAWIFDMEIDANGKLFFVGKDGETPLGLYRYENENWNQIFTEDLTIPYSEIAIDPFDNEKILIFSEGYSETYITTNAGSNNPTWTFKGIDRAAQNIPWLAWTETEWFTLGEIEFDPLEMNRVWITLGTGTFYIDLDNNSNFVWNEFSKGQEHLVSNDVISFSNGNKLTAHWDFPIFMHTLDNNYPNQHLPSHRFNSCWDLSQSPSDENFVVALIEDIRYCCWDDESRNSGFSEDGGQTWTQFPTMPGDEFELVFGQLEVSADNNNNIVWLPGQNKNPYYSLDKGTTWTEVDLPGDSESCCLDGPWIRRKALAADKVIQGKFYIYDWGSGDVFFTVDGGVSWSKNAAVLPSWSYNGKLITVPEHSDHLFFSNGPEDSEPLIEGLMRSTDGGVSWIEVANTSKVINVTIGKAAPNASYPTVYICGEVNGIYGYYESTDNCVSWTLIGDYPLGIYDWPVAFEANPFEYGNVVVGFAGNGFVQYNESSTNEIAVTERIHIDQFGYQPSMTKIAVLSNPQIGFNSAESYTPSSTLEVIRVVDDAVVYTGQITSWNNGQTHDQSGDIGWQFDFSSLTTPGEYYILDASNGLRSYIFEISETIYDSILIAATKMFYYNRCNMAKEIPFAHQNWTDSNNFNNNLQDGNARFIYDQSNANLEKDMTGGWFDAGDYNKYVTFAHGAVHNLLSAFDENSTVFSDNWNLPESGNGIPDLLDEINWELQWLEKMMNADGSVHIKIGSKNYDENSTYPPSNNFDHRYYGPECSAGSIAVASMFAHASWTYENVIGLENYSLDLKSKAITAFDFYLQKLENNDLDTDCDDGSIVSGDADWDEAKQKESALIAAVYLFDLTGEPLYGEYIIENVNDASAISAGWLGPYTNETMEAMFLYTTFPSADASTSAIITSSIFNHVSQDWDGFYGQNDLDLYRAYIPGFSYHWGSNQVKADYANLNSMVARYNINPSENTSYELKAEEMIHYYHGVNPLTKVYLSNMYAYGAENSVNEIYHAWFADGSDFDNALTSPYGPALGFVPGGANDGYTYTDRTPPYGQPAQKSYDDFNSISEFSWEITEPAIYYQAAYIRMLANYATSNTVLPIELISFNVEKNGENADLTWIISGSSNAEKFEIESSIDGQEFNKIGEVDAIQSSSNQTYTFIDEDISATYGNTDFIYYRLKMFDENGQYSYSAVKAIGITSLKKWDEPQIVIYPNPSTSNITIESIVKNKNINNIVIYNNLGQQIFDKVVNTHSISIDVSQFQTGSYVIEIISLNGRIRQQFIKI